MTSTQRHAFDLTRAAEHYRAALLRIVAVLFVYAGLDEGGADMLPRRAWRKILRLLRPAEAAVRRLIVIAARSVTVEPPKPRAEKEPTAIEQLQAAGLLTIHEGINFGLARAPQPQEAAKPQTTETRIAAFPLTDPPRRFDTLSWDGLRPFPEDGFELADADEEVSARHLCRRLAALKRALEDIDTHAKRLARWKARQMLLPNRIRRFSPMRRGWPPGRRKRPVHEVDDLLKDLNSLAHLAWDTS